MAGRPSCRKRAATAPLCCGSISPMTARMTGLEPIDWDKFFRIFDANGLTFLYQDEKEGGERSTFNKFVNDNEAD